MDVAAAAKDEGRRTFSHTTPPFFHEGSINPATSLKRRCFFMLKACMMLVISNELNIFGDEDDASNTSMGQLGTGSSTISVPGHLCPVDDIMYTMKMKRKIMKMKIMILVRAT
jgi:hypothetical protein